MISAYQKCVAETVRRFGAFVAKYMGDGVLVYFGYPQARRGRRRAGGAGAGLELVGAVSGRDADVLEIVVGQPAQHLAVDVVGAEHLGILGETDPRSEPSMSKFSPRGSCQLQSLKRVESLARAVIPRGSRTNLGFAMWTPTTRQQHSRTVTRYLTDLTDAEWHVIAPHLPKPCATGRPPSGRRRDRQRHLLASDAGGLPVAAAAVTTFRHGERFTAGSPSRATTGALNG